MGKINRNKEKRPFFNAGKAVTAKKIAEKVKNRSSRDQAQRVTGPGRREKQAKPTPSPSPSVTQQPSSWLNQGSTAGIGRADIDRALASGRTREEIVNELARAKAAGGSVGEKALSWSRPYDQRFDLQEAVQANQDYENQITSLEKFNQKNYGSFGAEALARARAAGMSDDDIRAGIERGRYTLGQKAYQDLYSNKSSPTGGGIGRPFLSKYGKVNFVSGEYKDQGDVATWDNDRVQDVFGSSDAPVPRISDAAVETAYEKNKINSYLKWLNQAKTNSQRFADLYLNT